MKHFKNLILGTIAALAGGCASLPTATYTTAGGCGIAQWTNEFVHASVASMSWTGPCENGLAHGKGALLVKLKDGKQRHYAGAMEKGGINGEGTYTRETGWKYEGNFLWLTFTSGKVYAADGRLVFHGRMAHNETYNGQNITFADQRYFEGALYFTDGSYITDGRYTGSAGPALGIGSIDPKTGKGIVYGKYVKDHQVVYRLVDGKLYPDEIAYLNAQTRYFEKIIAAQDAQNAAFTKAQEERSAKELRESVALLSNAAVAAAGGNTTTERKRLALEALAGNSPNAGSGGLAAAGSRSDMVEVTGSMAHCLKVVPAGNDPSVDTSRWAEGEPRSRIERAVVLVNTCPNYLDTHYCSISGGRNVLDGTTMETRFGCENLYGGDQIQRTGKMPRDQPLGTHPSTRFNFFDRKLITTPISIFACDAKTERIEVLRKGGITLAGNRACVKRRGNAFYAGPLDARIIPVE